MATEDYKSDSNCDLFLSCDSSPFGSVDFLIWIKNHRLTHTCMNQSSPICVLYLSDASNNEEKGRMKRENSDDHTHFFCSTEFILPSQRQKSITSATVTFFINKD